MTHHLSKAPPLNTITLGIRISTYEFEEGWTFRPWHLILISILWSTYLTFRAGVIYLFFSDHSHLAINWGTCSVTMGWWVCHTSMCTYGLHNSQTHRHCYDFNLQWGFKSFCTWFKDRQLKYRKSGIKKWVIWFQSTTHSEVLTLLVCLYQYILTESLRGLEFILFTQDPLFNSSFTGFLLLALK